MYFTRRKVAEVFPAIFILLDSFVYLAYYFLKFPVGYGRIFVGVISGSILIVYFFARLGLIRSGLKYIFFLMLGCVWIGFSYYRTLIVADFAPQVLFADFIYSLVLFFYAALMLGTGRYRAEVELNRCFHNIFISIAVVVVLNSIFFLFGQYTVKNELSLSALALGANVNRVHFPLAPGVNSYGYLLGLGLIIGAIIFSTQSKLEKGLTAIVVLLSVFQMFLVDSRGSFVFALSALALGLIHGRLRQVKLITSMFFSAFSIFVFYLSEKFFEILSNYLSSRGGDVSSQRDYIWSLGKDMFDRNGLPSLGYGVMGQHSGRLQFPDAVDESGLISMHNSYSQIVFDFGIVFYLIFLIFCMRLYLGVYERSDSVLAKLAYSSLTYAMLVSAFEINLTTSHPYYFLTFLIFLLVLGFSQNGRRDERFC